MDSLRGDFLLDSSLTFLNHGSFGACPKPVLAAQRAWQDRMEANPVAFLARRSSELLWEARTALAELLGARPDNLVFLPNATTGVNTVARSLPLMPGDEVLSIDHEYGACEAAWAFVCHRRGAQYRVVEIPLPFEAESFTERVWAAVTPRTRVLFLSHITSSTALILPIRELSHRARAEGIITLIDGAHAPGHIPVDLEDLGADFYCGNAHKWLCAPKGSAFLHAHPRRHALLEAPVVSWGYVPDQPANEAYTGRSALERKLQWQGTHDPSAFLAVPAALEYQRSRDWDRRWQECHQMAVYTLARVCERLGMEPACRDTDFGQMVILPVPACEPEALRARLFESYGIEVPVTTHQDRVFVRPSFQVYNTQEDSDRLIEALGTIF